MTDKENFKRVTESKVKGKYLSIRTRKSLGISSAMIDEFNIPDDNAQFYVNEDDMEIAMEISGSRGRSLTIKEESSVCNVYGGDIWEALGIVKGDIETAVRVPYTRHSEDFYVFDAEPLFNHIYTFCTCGKKYKETPSLQRHINKEGHEIDNDS